MWSLTFGNQTYRFYWQWCSKITDTYIIGNVRNLISINKTMVGVSIFGQACCHYTCIWEGSLYQHVLRMILDHEFEMTSIFFLDIITQLCSNSTVKVTNPIRRLSGGWAKIPIWTGPSTRPMTCKIFAQWWCSLVLNDKRLEIYFVEHACQWCTINGPIGI